MRGAMDAQSWTALASAVIALAALAFSAISFQRQQAQAKRQQDRAEELTMANVKPFLLIQSQTYQNLKSIRITNNGLGPAIIKLAEFRKPGGTPTDKIVELFDHLRKTEPRWRMWERFVNVSQNSAIPVQGDLLLIKQSLEHLQKQGVEEAVGLKLLSEWQKEKKGIEVYIEYEDIFGRKMEPLIDTLK
jgi:hypothetical protein